MMTNSGDNTQCLTTYLRQIPEGQIADTAELERLLGLAWDDFHGDYGGMTSQKLIGRMEEVLWQPPRLTFVIERHGGMDMGSTRARMQRWTVDLEQRMVRMCVWGYRQIIPRAAPLDVGPIAEEIVTLVLNGSEDRQIRWSRTGNVQVLIGKILPEDSACSQTLLRRRSRLSCAISWKLTTHGWRALKNSWYAPPEHPNGSPETHR